MAAPMGARVEIVEPLAERFPHGTAAELPCIKPTKILVNGTDVGLIERGSIKVEIGDDGPSGKPASVTFTLLAKSVEIKAV